jgi:hypothetical protein
LREGYETPSDLHAAMAASKYFVVTPDSPPKTGGEIVDAVSAGCVVVAPAATVQHFGQLTAPWLDFADDGGLLTHLDALERDPALCALARNGQAAIVRQTFWEFPLRNLELLLGTLRGTGAGAVAHQRAERRSRALIPLRRLRTSVRRRLRQ